MPLTAERFAPYGDVIAPEQAMKVRHINYGNTDRFHNLANLDLLKDGGKPLVSIFRSRPLPRPIPIKVMERGIRCPRRCPCRKLKSGSIGDGVHQERG